MRIRTTAWFAAILAFFALSAYAADSSDARKVVIPFDFVSKFDNGRYGQMVAESIWKKLARQEGPFIVPESMSDVRDACRANGRAPGMSLEKIRPIVVDDFGAQIGIWGSVERVTGKEADIYDLEIECVDFSTKPEPKVICEIKARTKSVSEIPHAYVKKLLDALYQHAPEAAPYADPVAKENWKRGPNLVVGGDFESAAGGVPKGWEPLAGQKREALGGIVVWAAEKNNAENHVIRFTLDRTVAENEGVMYYSKKFPIEAGATYRFQVRYRSDAPAAKVFLKCYDEIESEYRGGDVKASGKTKGDPMPAEGQLREVYRSQQNLKGPAGQWNTQTEDFTPKHTKYTPRWCSVMLYAYLQPGTVEWDDVIVKKIVPASSGEGAKEKRPSSATKVTVKEMEENERRSKAAEAKDAGKSVKPRRP